jgi:hypothetical protein
VEIRLGFNRLRLKRLPFAPGIEKLPLNGKDSIEAGQPEGGPGRGFVAHARDQFKWNAAGADERLLAARLVEF